MPRLFFALAVPERTSEDLDDLCDTVTDARWVGEAGYHLTLTFLGDVPHHQLAEVIDAGHSIRMRPLELTLRSVGVFPLRGEPRVLWAGVERNDALASMERTLKAELRRRGFLIEGRKFRPHVTVARMRESDPHEVADWLAHHLSFESGPFFVRRFQLYSSILRSEGSEYREEATFGGLK